MSGWAETVAAYRFFDNGKTTFEGVLAPHREATVEGHVDWIAALA